MTAPPMAYFGGKTRLAAKIAATLSPPEHYVEPFAKPQMFRRTCVSWTRIRLSRKQIREAR
ncbi:hypothetical protein [Mycobacterium avium]|uniref:hypothetical protein n=1 Tax=Mycobacterium avium TaxID=1764 RepID=UPI001593EB19|nr:hypothetical protein [Mycobacterium avium]